MTLVQGQNLEAKRKYLTDRLRDLGYHTWKRSESFHTQMLQVFESRMRQRRSYVVVSVCLAFDFQGMQVRGSLNGSFAKHAT